MKKSKTIALIITPVLSTLLFNACSSEPDSARDVYQTREECLKDWGDEELCEQMNDTDSDDYRRTGGVFVGRPFWGPRYYPGDRTVYYKGRTIAPTTKSTTMTPYTVTSRSSPSAKTGASSPGRSTSSTNYGGFGSKHSGGSSS